MKKSLIILINLIFFLLASGVSANKNIEIITKSQDYLVLGSIKDIDDQGIVITVDRVLGVKASGLVGEHITVEPFTYSYCIYHAPYDFTKPSVSDNLVISLDSNGETYSMKNGAYKVDTTEHSGCKIINHTEETNEDCIKELAEITCFIRSNAKIKEFSFDDEGNIFAVYPQSMEQCIQSVDNDGEVVETDEAEQPILDHMDEAKSSSKEKDMGKYPIYSVLVFLIGALLGLLITYFVVRKRASNN